MPTSASSDELTTFRYGAHIRANGIRQHYVRYGGRGRPLIVVPGITSPAITWGFVAERLGRGHDTYVIDVRGRGLSAAGPELSYSLDTYAEDVAELAKALDLREYTVLGHSMGGRIAVRLAAKHGGQLRRLILVDPPVSGPGRRPYLHSVSFYIDRIRAAKAGALDFAELRRSYPKWQESELRLRAEWLHTCDELAIAETVRGFQADDIHADFPVIRVPTLLVVAGAGGVITQADTEELRRLMPSLEVRTVENAGHMIPFEDLEGFLSSMKGFIDA